MYENFFIEFWKVNRPLWASFPSVVWRGRGQMFPGVSFNLASLPQCFQCSLPPFWILSPSLLHRATWSFSSEAFPWTSQGSADMTILSPLWYLLREKIDGSLQMWFTMRKKPLKFNISRSSFPEDTSHSPPWGGPTATLVPWHLSVPDTLACSHCEGLSLAPLL